MQVDIGALSFDPFDVVGRDPEKVAPASDPKVPLFDMRVIRRNAMFRESAADPRTSCIATLACRLFGLSGRMFIGPVVHRLFDVVQTISGKPRRPRLFFAASTSNRRLG
jgi:hypothetical protein